MTVRELITKLGFELDETNLNKANKKVKEFSMGSALAIGGLVAGIYSLGKAAVTAAADQEQLITNLSMMMGSQEKAVKFVTQLEEFGSGAAIPMQVLEKSAEKLMRAGMTSSNIIPTMKMIGDVSGGSREKMDMLTMAFARMSNTGRVSSRELMMMSRATPIFQILGQQLGVTQDQLKSMANKGQIAVRDVMAAFKSMTSEGGAFFKGLEKQSHTFNGLMIIMKNNMEQMLEGLGNVLLPPIEMIMSELTKLFKGPLGEILNGVFSALIPVARLVMGLVSKLLTALQPVLRIVQFVVDVFTKLLDVTKVLDPIMLLLTTVLGMVADILDALKPAIMIITEVLVQLAQIIVEAFVAGLMDMLKEMMPLIMMLANEFTYLIQALQPLFPVLVRIIGKEMQLGMKMWAGILKLVVGYFSMMAKILIPIANWLVNGLVPIIKWVYEKIEKIFDWANKLFNKTKTLNKEQKTAMTDMQETVINTQKELNLNMQNNFDINAQNTGLTPSGVNDMMSSAARGIFSMELRKVLISAIG